jgi:D-alanyl-D-alanine carboxypeptidase
MPGRFAAGVALLATLAVFAAPSRPASAHAAGNAVPADRAAALQTALDAVRAAGMPGLFAEVRDGNATWRGTSGVSDVSTGAPMRPGFEQRIGSITTGLIIERVTGQPVEAQVARRILAPLRLAHTFFAGIEPYLIGPHSLGYVPWTDGRLRDFSTYNMSWAWAAGAMVSTTRDVNDFYAALLSGRLLPPGLLASMQATVPENAADPTGTGYGLGLVATRAPCGTAWGHGGGVFGYGTQTLRLADGSHQVTVADNMTLYEPADVIGPIDLATINFLIVALCGTTSTTGASRMTLPR